MIPAWIGNAPASPVAGRPPLVLLHGVGGGKSQWREQLDALAMRGWQAYAWDMPGYGDSALPSVPYSFALLADALCALLDALRLERAVLIGHSMGGMVALEAFATYPQRIAGLVLACTSAKFGGGDGDWQRRFIAERVAPLDAGLGMANLAAQQVPRMMLPSAPATARAAAIEVMGAVPEATYRRSLAALPTFDRREVLARIDVPTLALAAAGDVQAPPAVMEKMAARIPNAEVVVLPDCAHLANFERPDLFDHALVEFLERRCAGGAQAA